MMNLSKYLSLLVVSVTMCNCCKQEVQKVEKEEVIGAWHKEKEKDLVYHYFIFINETKCDLFTYYLCTYKMTNNVVNSFQYSEINNTNSITVRNRPQTVFANKNYASLTLTAFDEPCKILFSYHQRFSSVSYGVELVPFKNTNSINLNYFAKKIAVQTSDITVSSSLRYDIVDDSDESIVFCIVKVNK